MFQVADGHPQYILTHDHVGLAIQTAGAVPGQPRHRAVAIRDHNVLVAVPVQVAGGERDGWVPDVRKRAHTEGQAAAGRFGAHVRRREEKASRGGKDHPPARARLEAAHAGSLPAKTVAGGDARAARLPPPVIGNVNGPPADTGGAVQQNGPLAFASGPSSRRRCYFTNNISRYLGSGQCSSSTQASSLSAVPRTSCMSGRICEPSMRQAARLDSCINPFKSVTR